MPADRGEPWGGATYNGFSGPGPDTPPEPLRQPRPGFEWPAFTRSRTLMGGVAAAVGLGLVLGVWAHPHMGADGKAREPMAAVTSDDGVMARVPIEVNQPAPPPAVRSAGRMEVLPPDMVRAARPATVSTAPAPPMAAIGSGADAAAFASERLDAPPPEPLTRAERRALREDRFLEVPPPPPMSRAERRALREEPLYVPPPEDDEPEDEPGA